jgi:lambda family phage tail tape measure protein
VSNETSIVLTADSSGYIAALDKAVKSNDALRKSVAASADVMQAKYKALTDLGENASEAAKRQAISQVNSMAMMAATAGKTAGQIALMRAEAVGAGEAVRGFYDQIAKGSASAHSGMAGVSRELLVMAHEGLTGNFKRMAGSSLVLAERVNLLSLVMSPLGAAFALGAGAVAAFTYEVAKGYEQTEAFNRAINATGGYVGLSAAQMVEMSNGLQTSTASLSDVREAMAQVASTGAFTGDQLQLATKAAIAMGSDIGIGTEKAAESLAKIQDNVQEWVSKYQQAHHAFSAAQIEEIDNFVKLGDTAGATKAIMSDLVGEHAKIEADANAHMGAVLTWYRQWGDVIDQVKAKLFSIGTPDSIDKQVGDQYARVEAAQARLKQNQQMGGFGNVGEAQAALAVELKKLDVLRQQQTVEHQTQQQRERDAKGGDAKVAVDSYVNSDKYATPARRQALDLKQEDEAFAKATANLQKNSADYQAALKRHYENVAQINEQYAKKSGSEKLAQNELGAQLSAIQGRNQLIEQATKDSLSHLKSAYEQGAMNYQTYLNQVRGISAMALDDEIANADKRVELAKGKKNLSAEQEALTEYRKLLAERKKVDDDYTESLKTAQQARADALSKFTAGLQEGTVKQAHGYTQQDAARFMTPTQKADYSQDTALYDQYLQQMDALRQKYQFSPEADQQLYQQQLQALTANYNQQEQMLQQHLAYEQEVRSSFSDQMTLQLVKLSGDGQTAAQATSDAFGKAWDDSSNALNTFLTTGKGNFDKFASGVLADMATIALKFAEMQAMQGLLNAIQPGASTSSLLGLFGSMGSAVASGASGSAGSVGGNSYGFHFATGGHINGPGTGTSDSIPAMLSNGEYIVNAASTQKYRGVLDAINSGNMSHFATGGAVGSVQSSGSSSGGDSNPVSVIVNHNGGGGLSDQDAKDLHTMVRSFVDQRMSYQMRRQGGYAQQIKYGQI